MPQPGQDGIFSETYSNSLFDEYSFLVWSLFNKHFISKDLITTKPYYENDNYYHKVTTKLAKHLAFLMDDDYPVFSRMFLSQRGKYIFVSLKGEPITTEALLKSDIIRHSPNGIEHNAFEIFSQPYLEEALQSIKKDYLAESSLDRWWLETSLILQRLIQKNS